MKAFDILPHAASDLSNGDARSVLLGLFLDDAEVMSTENLEELLAIETSATDALPLSLDPFHDGGDIGRELGKVPFVVGKPSDPLLFVHFQLEESLVETVTRVTTLGVQWQTLGLARLFKVSRKLPQQG